MNRRRFLELSTSGVVAALIAQLPWKTTSAQENAKNEVSTDLATKFPPIPEFLHLDELHPNDEANLVNAVVVPRELLPRTNREKVKMSVDFSTTFNKDNPDRLRNNLWGYGESVKDAIRRGQEVWLVLDIPDTEDQVRLDDLARYFSAVAKEYSTMDVSGVYKTARFVVGNELNAYPKTRAESYIRWYAKVYTHAVLSMRKVSPNIRLFLYAEAYYDSGKTLDTSLALIKQEFSLLRTSDKLVDTRDEPITGLCFHYYDDKTGIRERASLYRQLSRSYGLPASIHLLELGKPELTRGNFSSLEHQHVIVRNLTEALALIKEGIIETVFWHTAESVDDTRGHALFIHEGSRFEPKPQLFTFLTLSKLLHHDVAWEMQEIPDGTSKITVSGLTSTSDRSVVTWTRLKNSDGKVLSESEPEIRIYPASKLSLRRSLVATFNGLSE